VAVARQREMLASAAAQRQAQRAYALAKANRRVERAEHRLSRSMLHAMRLHADVAVGQGR
jgi:hypothetical protein